MKYHLKKITALALILALLCALFPVTAASAATAADVGSLWDSYQAGSGTFSVSGNSRVFVASDAAPEGDLLQTAQLLQRELRAQFGTDYFKEMVWGEAAWARTGDVVLVLDTASGTGDDGYKLNVTSATATVTSADTDGLIYGTNNLMKCFLATGGKAISCFTGADTPDTRERTVSLDCGRKYLTAEWIKNFIRQMSWMGYNTLQLHFSDDGGFRIDLWDPEYFTSANGNDFSWLAGSATQTWVYNGNKNNSSYNYKTDPDKNKHLTAAELVEICNVAKEYHIDIIPSFDSPSHMDYITWRYEYQANNYGVQFVYDGTTYTGNYNKNYCINYTGKTAYSLGEDQDDGPTNWPCYTTIDITDGTYAKAFVFALYEDIADFFKQYAGSTKFSIGADEVNLTSSASYYPRKWSASQFPGYINDLNELLNNRGYTMRMYNDFMGSSNFSLSDFDSNIEIQYWDSPFKPNSGEKGSGKAASSFVSDGRTIYNCIQTHTYYVLRVDNSSSKSSYTDARNPANRQWTFYHSTEDLIYNEWVPNNVSEKGDYTESVANIPDNNLGGAYFLVWNDYPTVSTESQLWNGAPDTTGTNNGVVYYLLDRMASNVIKMWNWDINKSVSYSKFAAVRDTFGDFPGFTTCSAKPELPAADGSPEQAWAADHSALTAALEDAIADQGNYTDESWNAYQTALQEAEEVNADHAATQAEVNAALAALTEAAAGLTEKIVVDRSALKAALEDVITDGSKYSEESWSDYQAAVAAAWDVYNNEDATQKEVDTALANLLAAEDSLQLASPEPEGDILKVEKLTETARLGKQIGLRITTEADVERITVLGETLTVCNGKVQTITDYDREVKIWLIAFDADSAGTFNYAIISDNGSAEVRIVVR